MWYLYIILKLEHIINSLRFYKIASGSLIPTIMMGDWIVALKVWPKGKIKRRDMIVFPFPPDPTIDYVKRVIGLPGETLEISIDRVFINGEFIDEPYVYFEPEEKSSKRAQG